MHKSLLNYEADLEIVHLICRDQPRMRRGIPEYMENGRGRGPTLNKVGIKKKAKNVSGNPIAVESSRRNLWDGNGIGNGDGDEKWHPRPRPAHDPTRPVYISRLIAITCLKLNVINYLPCVFYLLQSTLCWVNLLFIYNLRKETCHILKKEKKKEKFNF